METNRKSDGMNATVLLIDYDPYSICRIEGVLSALGLKPIVARDGLSGVEAFLRHLPDLTLIQDLVPRKHGFDVCRELKATEHGRRSAVVLLADVRNGRRYAAMATGCDDFVPKPIDGQILVEKVRKLLPNAERPTLDAIPVPDPTSAPQGDPPKAAGKPAKRRSRKRSKPLTNLASPR